MALNYGTQLRHSITALNYGTQLRRSITALNYGTLHSTHSVHSYHSIHSIHSYQYELGALSKGVNKICTTRDAHLKRLNLKIKMINNLILCPQSSRHYSFFCY